MVLSCDGLKKARIARICAIRVSIDLTAQNPGLNPSAFAITR